MTNRHRILTVVLDEDTRIDSLDALRDAIGQLRGVAAVEVGPPVTGTDCIARETAKQELRRELWDALGPNWGRLVNPNRDR